MDRNGSRGDQEALRDLAHLTAGVGHQLINAYSTAVSGAEIQRLSVENGLDYDPEAIASGIIESALAASKVARLLIDTTRPYTVPEHPEPVDLRRLLEEFLARQGSRPSIRFVTSLEDGGTILGDPAALADMLDRFVANAVEAMPPEGGTIQLTLGRDDRGWPTIEVRDDGPGMAPEVHERALEPFFTTKDGHAGIGLTIALGIWRRHRGSLSIQSVPGEGTRLLLAAPPAEGH